MKCQVCQQIFSSFEDAKALVCECGEIHWACSKGGKKKDLYNCVDHQVIVYFYEIVVGSDSYASGYY